MSGSVPEQPEEELIGFDSKLCELLQRFRSKCIKDTPTNREIIEYVEAHAKELLSLARKQIAEEVNVDIMINEYIECITEQAPLFIQRFLEVSSDIYRQGILDTLEKIEGK